MDANARYRHQIAAPVDVHEVGPPEVDDDGVLRFSGRWVAVSIAQLPVVRLLIARFGDVVDMADVVAAYGDAGYMTTERAVHSLVTRLQARVATVGLHLATVRSKGLVLAPQITRPVTGEPGPNVGGVSFEVRQGWR